MKRLIYVMLFASLMMAGCMEPTDLPDAIPQERCRWPNPRGYGLEPETEPYTGLFY